MATRQKMASESNKREKGGGVRGGRREKRAQMAGRKEERKRTVKGDG